MTTTKQDQKQHDTPEKGTHSDSHATAHDDPHAASSATPPASSASSSAAPAAPPAGSTTSAHPATPPAPPPAPEPTVPLGSHPSTPPITPAPKPKPAVDASGKPIPPTPYKVPDTLAKQEAEIVLQTREMAGGGADFLVMQLTNAMEPAPGTVLTLDQVEAIAAAGWKVKAVSALPGQFATT